MKKSQLKSLPTSHYFLLKYPFNVEKKQLTIQSIDDMSDNKTVEEVNKESASAADLHETDSVSLQASEALLGLLETQAPAPPPRVSIGSPVSSDDPTSYQGISLAQQSSMSSSSDEEDDLEEEFGVSEDAATVVASEVSPNKSDDNDDDECLPVGWMTASLQEMERDFAKKVKALNKEISGLKKRNERLNETLGSVRGEVKTLKKNNAALTKENSRLAYTWTLRKALICETTIYLIHL